MNSDVHLLRGIATAIVESTLSFTAVERRESGATFTRQKEDEVH
jgi:hypothetical protein